LAETPFERGWAERLNISARMRATLLSWPLALALILLAGALLRFHGLRWDQPAGAQHPLQMQPDERSLSFVLDGTDWPESLGAYFDTAKSPLNPYNVPNTNSYVYGTFPLFLVKGVATIAGDDPAGPGNSYDTDVIWGRRITAAFDVATIAVVFGLASLLFGRGAGLLASLLYGLAVLPTQLSHFFAMDPYVTFFATLTLLLSALLVQARGWRAEVSLAAAIGLAIGLGLASKVTAWPMVLAPAVAVAIRMGLRDLPQLGLRWRGERFRPGGHWSSDFSLLCAAAVVAMLVFRLAQPYAFEGPHFWDMGLSPRWKDDILGEYQRQNGDAFNPPFVQFAARTPFLDPMKNMLLFGLGPALGLAAFLAAGVAGVFLFKRRELRGLIPLVLVLAVLGFQGPRFVTFMRYFAPMYPALCVFAGWGALAAWRWARRPSPSGFSWRVRGRLFPAEKTMRWTAAAGVVVVLVSTVAWALAFQQVYRVENPRLQASRWIYANLPPGTTITGEYWDDTLPYELPGQQPGSYPLITTYPYDTDSPAKVRALVYGPPENPGQGLIGADYVAISSNRVRGSVPRLERRYPATIRYYQLLDSGELGFEKVATFSLRPSLLGIRIDDSGADESFTVYDHPEVRLYKKTANFDPARALALLQEAHPERAVELLPKQGRTNGLHLTPAQAQVQQAGGTFSDIFDAGGWASSAPALWWLLWLELAALATLPWATWLFRTLPDRGYGLSKVLGITSVALPAWLAVAWGAAHFSMGLAWGVYGAVVAAGIVVGALRRRALLADLKSRWPSWLMLEAVFLAAFAGFLLLRYHNPDLWHNPQGGEKPVELAYLTAVARSSILPPYDPWFAGGTMNYYYMGWFFLAVPLRAFRLLPEVGFNLGVPTFAALAVATAASTAHNLVALSARRFAPASRRPRLGLRPALAAGVLGAILLAGVGNLDAVHQLVERLQALNQWSLFEGKPVIGGVVSLAGGAWERVAHGAPLPPFDWWRSSRVHFGAFDITEFPYWTFLFGDLHPHLMGLGFFGLVIALAAAYVTSAWRALQPQQWALSVAMGLALGLERTMHTWDFPTAVLITAAAIVLGQCVAPGRRDLRWWRAVAHLAIAAVVLTVAFAPYTAHFEVSNSGLERTPETTKANQYFAHFGVFVCFALAFLTVRYREELGARGGRAGSNVVLGLVAGRFEFGSVLVFTAGLAVFTWRWGLTVVALTILLEVFLVNLLWLELRRPRREPGRLLATAMFALAFAIAGGVDVVVVKNDIVRMNTVFKFSLQAWQLFALASAFAGWYVARALWRVEGLAIWPRARHASIAYATTLAGVALILAGSLYLAEGTGPRQRARFADLPPTLNGLAYLPFGVFREDGGVRDNPGTVIRLGDDLPLIIWLRDNVRGSPVITEAVGPLYHWTGRMSWNTGLPAVIGWDWHEVAYRMEYAPLVQQRRADTARFYTDADARAALQYLRKYDVSYIVVGTEELVLGTPEGLAKIARLPGLAEVFRNGQHVIYRVDKQAVDAALG
jgi:YYY domain-containing protein